MGSSSLIALTRGYFAFVDAEDFDRLAQINWRANIQKDGNVYAVAHRPGSGKRGKSLIMHRFIMGVDDPSVKVDHRNGNTLDNTRNNLRVSTNAQNIRNQRPHRDKRTSRLKGVYKRPDGRYRAQIMVQYKKLNLGNYATEEAAALAYDAKARELHGEFARVNFPERAA